MLIKEDYLIKINNKNRIQKVLIKLTKSDSEDSYILNRITSQYGGKETSQPVITIGMGKVKRTVAEQAMLVYNSHVKKYLDGGYSLLSKVTSKSFKDLSEEELKTLLGGTVTDQSGVPKPMLAKLADQCSPDVFEDKWYVSRKLDGTRCLLYYRDGEIKSASRGGANYDAAITHIRTDENVIKFFKDHPDIILDGEIYKHDALYPLQRISGLVRLKEASEECKVLEYWVYDYISNKKFSERWEDLENWASYFKNTKIKILEQKLMSGYLSIKREHDKYVQEGFEGLCMRNPNKEYGINKRSGVYLIKMKERQDSEFQIVDVREGLRPEDMCFVLKTDEGKEFAAKPMGDVQTRLEYLKNKDKYIGKLGTCTYFALSNDGIPTQPVLKNIRIPEDIDF